MYSQYTADILNPSDVLNIPRCTEHTLYRMPLLADLFLYSYENEFLAKLIKEGKRKLARKFNLSYCYILDKLIKEGKERLLESSIYHIVTLMTLSLSIIKDLRSSFLIFIPKNSQFLKPQNLPQLLFISICFSPEIRATT